MSPVYLSPRQQAAIACAAVSAADAHVELAVAEDGADFETAVKLFACRRHLDAVLHLLDELADFDTVDAALSFDFADLEPLPY